MPELGGAGNAVAVSVTYTVLFFIALFIVLTNPKRNKYKILEKRYGVGYFDSCIQLYYNGHISAYILGNKVFRAVILWK